MKNFLFFFLSIFTLVPLCQAELVDKSVAVVNDDIITLSEVNQLAEPMLKKAAKEVPAEQLDEIIKEIRQSAVKKLIEQRLLEQTAQEKKISIPDEEVQQALDRILEKNKMTKQDFYDELNSMGMTEKMYRDDLRSQILRSKLVSYEVRSQVIIPEERIIDYYDQHFTKKIGEGGYYLLQIGTTWEKEGFDKMEAKKRISEVYQKVIEGGDFRELAKEYSELPSRADGGDLGIFKEDEMAPFMKEAVLDLKAGGISKVVEGPSSYQFFSLLSSEEGEVVTTVPYESVKEEIREKLYEEEMEKRYKEWVEDLRGKAYIKIL